MVQYNSVFITQADLYMCDITILFYMYRYMNVFAMTFKVFILDDTFLGFIILLITSLVSFLFSGD